MAVALRRKHPYDVFWMHGQPDEIARDTLFKGTALSAPLSNLLTHAAMTVVVSRRPSRRTEQALGGVGALLVAGYLGERLVRKRLRPSGWDRLETPLLVVAIGLAVAMAVIQAGPGLPADPLEPLGAAAPGMWVVRRDWLGGLIHEYAQVA